MEFLTPQEVAKILRCSAWFVYANRKLLGGIKIGKIVRFEKEIFESKLKEVINDSSTPPEEMEVRLLEERSEAKEKRIPHQAGRKNSGSRSSQTSEEYERELYKIMRQQAKRP